MIVYKEDRRVAYTPKQMFDLVADVEKYPEFVPGCRHVAIMWKGGGKIEARMKAKSLGMTTEFTSKVSFDEPKSIDIMSQGQPFKRLASRWSFDVDDAGGGCLVAYQMELEVGIKMLEGTVAALLAPAAKKTVEAFIARADALYGAKPAS